MAYEEAVRSITLEADSSVAVYTGVPGQPGSANPNGGKQYYFVKVTAAHTAGLAVAAANEVVIGVLQNKPQYLGDPCTVAIRGVVLVTAGVGGLTAGDAVKVENTGKGVNATLPGDLALVVGVALETGAADSLVPVLLRAN